MAFDCMLRISEPAPGFGHRERVHLLASNGGQQETFSLLSLARHENVLRSAPKVGECHRASSEFALQKGEAEVVEPSASHFDGKVRRIKAQCQHFVLDRLGKRLRDKTFSFDLFFVRIDFLFDKAAHGVDDEGLFGGQGEVHARIVNCNGQRG